MTLPSDVEKANELIDSWWNTETETFTDFKKRVANALAAQREEIYKAIKETISQEAEQIIRQKVEAIRGGGKP